MQPCNEMRERNEGMKERRTNARCERKEVNGEKGPGRELKRKMSERTGKRKGVGGWSVSVSHADRCQGLMRLRGTLTTCRVCEHAATCYFLSSILRKVHGLHQHDIHLIIIFAFEVRLFSFLVVVVIIVIHVIVEWGRVSVWVGAMYKKELLSMLGGVTAKKKGGCSFRLEISGTVDLLS